MARNFLKNMVKISHLIQCILRPWPSSIGTNYGIATINYIYILIEHCTTGDIRLYGGTYYYGVVQVCIGGVWASVCRDSFWDNNDASVVCKQLGFSPYGITA